MKKLRVLAVAFLAGSIAATAAYNVTGKIENNGGTRIYLVTRTGTNTIDTIATSLTPDGSFVSKVIWVLLRWLPKSYRKVLVCECL